MLAISKVKCQNLVVTYILKNTQSIEVPSKVKKLLSNKYPSQFITFRACYYIKPSMLGPKCNNGFITFGTNGLLHFGPNFITFRTFITCNKVINLVLHLGPLLHLGPNPYYT